MNINYTVKKMALKDSSKNHIEQKIKKLDKFFSDNAVTDIMLRLEKDRVIAELTIRDGSMVYRAEDSQSDLLDAFDNSYDNIIRRIRKQKTKLSKRLRSTAFEQEAVPDEIDDGEDFVIIKSKKFNFKPQSVQEAILQMKLLGHKFYVFRNDDNNEICVVYERNDGNYGIIEPK